MAFVNIATRSATVPLDMACNDVSVVNVLTKYLVEYFIYYINFCDFIYIEFNHIAS